MFGFDGLFGAMMVIGFVAPIAVTVLVIGVIVYAVRRSTTREDPAVAELRARYARGEIDPSEFEVRLRSLTRER